MADFILGSGSPRRKDMLTRAGYVFEVVVSPDDEDMAGNGHLAPEELAVTLARTKAEGVVKIKPDDIVLTADTIVVLDDSILGKPIDKTDAQAMLTRLSGRNHLVMTGFCLQKGNKSLYVKTVTTEVTFRVLRSKEIDAYVATNSPLDKAGAYGIQDMGGGLVRAIKGSYTNVVGLPMAEVIDALAELRVKSRLGDNG